MLLFANTILAPILSSQSRVAQALRWHSAGSWWAKTALPGRSGCLPLQTTKKRPDFHPVSLIFNSYGLAGPLITAFSAQNEAYPHKRHFFLRAKCRPIVGGEVDFFSREALKRRARSAG